MPKRLPKPTPTAQKKEKKSSQIKVRLDESLFWKVRRHTNLMRMGMSEFIRLALEAEMNRLNQFPDPEI